MVYDSQEEALAEGRCAVELERGGYCGMLPVSAFGQYRDLSHYENPARCKIHQHRTKVAA